MTNHEWAILEIKPALEWYMQPSIQECNQKAILQSKYYNDTCKQHKSTCNKSYTHNDAFHNNNLKFHMMKSLQPWNTSCKCNKHMEFKDERYICNWNACMTNKKPIQVEGWTMLSYHSGTPSSHIYPSNWLAGVNMWQEATMIWFDLLSHVKEVEPMETHHTNIQH